MPPQSMDSPEIQYALEQVLNTARFKSSPQMSAFIRYIVEQTLDGHAERIKAYTIAVDALGKPDSFDPQTNPSVRVLAKRLRDNLQHYYAHDGKNNAVRITLRPGSYIPHFTKKSPEPGQTMDKPSVDDGSRVGNQSSWSRILQNHRRAANLTGILVLVILTLHFFSSQNRPAQSNHFLSDQSRSSNSIVPTITVDIASMEEISPEENRPSVPKLILINHGQVTRESQSIGQLLHGIVENYQHIIVDRKQAGTKLINASWPEYYELHYSMTSDGDIALSLIHAQTGDTVQNKNIHTPGGQAEKPSISDLQLHLAAYGKSLLKTGGTLLTHYQQNVTVTPTMRCLFLFDQYYSDRTKINLALAKDCAAKLFRAGKIRDLPVFM